jgi:hypothetical protein
MAQAGPHVGANIPSLARARWETREWAEMDFCGPCKVLSFSFYFLSYFPFQLFSSIQNFVFALQILNIEQKST